MVMELDPNCNGLLATICPTLDEFLFPDLVAFLSVVLQGWISDMGIDGPTFVPKSGYFLLIWVKVCPQKLAFP